MKDMIYKTEREFEILDMGRVLDYEYYIISLGIYPVAYISIPEGHPVYGIDYEKLDINVHGGLTFSSDELYLNDFTLKGSFIGWDYAHFSDFSFYMDISFCSRKWTTIEIRYEVLKVCEQLEEIRLNRFYDLEEED